jgi:putative tryptophan/tyrosine transport system substrate-binding protein
VKRREFITLLGGAAAWPLAANAQQPAMPVIGFLNSASPEPYAPAVSAFRQGLKETGYVEGQNVAVEYRWAKAQYDRVSAMAAELLDRRVAVIIANTPGVQAIKAVITRTPIVFTTGSDPVQLGLVASLSRPGGNVTGVTTLNVEVTPKRLELAHELLPAATTIAVLVNPSNPNTEIELRGMQSAGRALGLQLHVVHASSERDFGAAFETLSQLRASVLVISGTDTFLISNSKRLAELAIRHEIPAIFQFREFVAAGGLMSYGGSLKDSYRQAGIYAGRILKGEKPADLPVQQSATVELMINLKTAKGLGLTVPTALLVRADEVIE